MDEANWIVVGAEIAVVQNGGCGDLDLPRDVIQRKETAKGGPEVLALVRPKEKGVDGMGGSRECRGLGCGA